MHRPTTKYIAEQDIQDLVARRIACFYDFEHGPTPSNLVPLERFEVRENHRPEVGRLYGARPFILRQELVLYCGGPVPRGAHPRSTLAREWPFESDTYF